MVRVGLIGSGKIAQVRHIPEYMENPCAELAAVYDVNIERAETLAKKYGARVYYSYEELLADQDIDAVSVLTPNNSHAEISIAALKAGKHVLCEKPMATVFSDCIKMEQEAKLAGKKLMIAQNQRLAPAHIKARELLREGVIGRPIAFCTVFTHGGAENWSVDGKRSWFMDKSKSSFGAMADLGVHKLDLMVYLLGTNIVKVSAVTGTLEKKDADGKPILVDDNAFCTLIMEDGVMGTLHAGWTNYGREENFVSVYGTLGALHIYRGSECAVEVQKRDGGVLKFSAGAIQTNEQQSSSGVIDQFIMAIESDIPSPISAQMVLPAMKAVFACAESAERGGALIDCGKYQRGELEITDFIKI